MVKRMTAKRFTETVSTGIVTDHVTGKEYKCEMRIDDELLELLNKLADENEQLKKENQMLKHTIGRNENYIARITHKGEWKDTSKPMYRSISRGD